MRKEIEVTVEKHEILILRRHRGPIWAWCSGCNACVDFLLTEDACSAAGVTARELYRWVEEGRLHFNETDQGIVLVCVDSLVRWADKNAQVDGARKGAEPALNLHRANINQESERPAQPGELPKVRSDEGEEE